MAHEETSERRWMDLISYWIDQICFWRFLILRRINSCSNSPKISMWSVVAHFDHERILWSRLCRCARSAATRWVTGSTRLTEGFTTCDQPSAACWSSTSALIYGSKSPDPPLWESYMHLAACKSVFTSSEIIRWSFRILPGENQQQKQDICAI